MGYFFGIYPTDSRTFISHRTLSYFYIDLPIYKPNNVDIGLTLFHLIILLFGHFVIAQILFPTSICIFLTYII